VRFLEFFQDQNEEWKILLTTKTPIFNCHEEVKGTCAYAVDITFLFLRINEILNIINFKQTNSYTSENNIYTIFQDSPKNKNNLTKKQIDVLFFLSKNKTAKEIGRLLNVSHRSIEDRIERIKAKLNCYTRSELFETAYEQGLFNTVTDTLLTKPSCIFLEEID